MNSVVKSVFTISTYSLGGGGGTGEVGTGGGGSGGGGNGENVGTGGGGGIGDDTARGVGIDTGAKHWVEEGVGSGAKEAYWCASRMPRDAMDGNGDLDDDGRC